MFLLNISFFVQQEAGRYPAYKEMVAEYGWLKKCTLTTPKECFLQNIIFQDRDTEEGSTCSVIKIAEQNNEDVTWSFSFSFLFAKPHVGFYSEILPNKVEHWLHVACLY